MYLLNLRGIMRDLVCLVDSVMYPLNLFEIMWDLVMPLCCFGYVSFVFVVSVMFV